MAKRKTFSLNKNLQEGLTQTMSAVKNYAGELHFEIIPLHQIELDPENPRHLHISFADLPDGPAKEDPLYQEKIEEINKLNSLAETISKQGLINPIVVYKHGARYRLVAGERRCLASMIAGKSDIKANVLNERPSDLRRGILQWIENIEREDLTLWERLQNIRQILTAQQQDSTAGETPSATLLKNLLGCSLPQAMNYFAVLNTDEKLSTAIKNNAIRNLEKAALLARIADAPLREQAIDHAIAGASLKALKDFVQQHEQHKQAMMKRQMKHRLANNRGRKNERINLGSVKKPQLVKTLVESVLAQDKYKHYRSKFEKTNWHDYASASLAFKDLLSIIESIEGI